MVSRGLSANDREEILNNISDILTKVEFENIGQVQLFNSVMRFLDLCKLSNIKLSILTRASKKYTKKCLEITGTAYYFNLVFTRDDFTLLRAKPHIDSINRVINELGIENKFILFVGDHPLDQICAQNGNIRFIGIIPDGNDKYGLKDIDCWKIVNNYQELYDIVKNLNNKDVEVDN